MKRDSIWSFLILVCFIASLFFCAGWRIEAGKRMAKIDKHRYALEPFASYIPDHVTFDPDWKVLTWPILIDGATVEKTLYVEDFQRAKDVLELTK